MPGMIAVRIFEITFPIFVVILAGLLYARRFRPDMTLPNQLNMHVFIPALLFTVLIERTGVTGLFGPLALGCALIILLSGIIAWGIARSLHIDPRSLCPPLMFSNAGNLGLPLIVLTFGEKALGEAVVVFITCNFLHITLGSYIFSRQTNLLKVFMSPMILATLLALTLLLLNVTVPELILQPVSMLGNIAVPLLMFSLGVRLLDTELSEWRIGMLAAVLAPVIGVILVFIITPLLDLTKLEQGVLFLFGALPPAVMNFIFAEHFKQEPSKVASMVLYGNAFSIVSIPLALAYVLPRFA